jgi:hypothetical protein
MSSTRSEFSAGEPSFEPPPLRKRGSRGPARFLITFCSGVAATLAWQSYGDVVRQTVASSYPQLGWLAPQAAIAQTIPDTIAPPVPSPDQQELKTISLGVAALRQRVDQLAAGQAQIARDFTTKLQAAEQDILDKISPAPPPAAAPARRPVPPPPQAAPLR